MACIMCDPDGNPCDECKIYPMEEREADYYAQLAEEAECKK